MLRLRAFTHRAWNWSHDKSINPGGVDMAEKLKAGGTNCICASKIFGFTSCIHGRLQKLCKV